MKLGTIYLGTFGKGASPDWNLFRWVGSDKFRLRVWPLITVGMWGMSVVRKEQAPTNEPPETLRAGVKAGQEARQRGDVQSLKDVKSELASTNETPETGTVCPCIEALKLSMCLYCKSRGMHVKCATPGCIDGRIQEGTTP